MWGLKTGPRSPATWSAASPTPSWPPTTSTTTCASAPSAPAGAPPPTTPGTTPPTPAFSRAGGSSLTRSSRNKASYVVATTPNGFFVLADRSSPHAACVFNPLTGSLTRFAGPVPPEVGVIEVVCDIDGFFLYFLSDSSRKIYIAAPESEGFDVSTDCQQGVYNYFRDAVLGGAYPHISAPALFDVFSKFFDFLMSLRGDSLKFFSGDIPGDALKNMRFQCFVVGLAAEVFLHIEREGRTLIVFKVNTEIGKIEPVESVGTFAIFIGYHRCLAVDADKFPGIEANCIYHTQHSGSSAHISKYNLKDKKVERLSAAAEFMKQDKQFVLVAARPFTIIQLLCSYTVNHMDSELALQPMV